MTKTITQLWYGNLEPICQFGAGDAKIKQLENLIQRNLDKLEMSLDETQKKILQKYADCIKEYLLTMNEHAFCDGYCLGTKLTAEALIGAEKAAQ